MKMVFLISKAGEKKKILSGREGMVGAFLTLRKALSLCPKISLDFIFPFAYIIENTVINWLTH